MARLSALVGAVIVTIGTVASSATPQDPPAAPSPLADKQTRPTFRSGVEIMTVSVTVTDRNGRPVNDLTQKDFVVFEDTREQEIVSFRSVQSPIPEPIGLGLVLDLSASMGPQPQPGGLRSGTESRLPMVKTAVERLVRQRLRKGDEVYLLAFRADTELLQPWTTDHDLVVNTIRGINPRRVTQSGWLDTGLYDAIAAALRMSSRGRSQKQVMLLITDGGDNASLRTRDVVAELALASGVRVYALLAQGEELVRLREPAVEETVAQLSEITDPTGGLTRQVAGFQQLEDAILKLGKEFTHDYEIGYARRQADGAYHRIVVDVRRPGVTIRHRRGYLAD